MLTFEQIIDLDNSFQADDHDPEILASMLTKIGRYIVKNNPGCEFDLNSSDEDFNQFACDFLCTCTDDQKRDLIEVSKEW